VRYFIIQIKLKKPINMLGIILHMVILKTSLQVRRLKNAFVPIDPKIFFYVLQKINKFKS